MLSMKICCFLNASADLYALSRYFAASSRVPMDELQTSSSSGAEQAELAKKGTQADESQLRLAQLQHQLPANEPGTLMHLVEDAAGGDSDDDDADRRECKSLFKNLKFFLSREVSSTLSWELYDEVICIIV